MKIKYKYDCVDNLNILAHYSTYEDFDDWYKIVKPILKHKEFQKRRLFIHHENESLWTHSIKVSFNAYRYAKKHNINTYNCAIAGLLHDFYTSAWQYSEQLEKLNKKYRYNFINGKKKKISEMHAFTHPKEALDNSKKYFKKYLNKEIENTIVTHMFPLSLLTEYKFPKYKEGYVITLIDKFVSLNILHNIKSVPKYFGLTKIN